MKQLLLICFLLSNSLGAFAVDAEFDISQMTSVYKVENIYRNETDLYLDWKLGIDAYHSVGDVTFIAEANVYYGDELSYDIERLLIELFLGNVLAINMGRFTYDAVETVNDISPVFPVLGPVDGVLTEIYIGSDGSLQAGAFAKNAVYVKNFVLEDDLMAAGRFEYFIDPINVYAGAFYNQEWEWSGGLSIGLFDAVVHGDYVYRNENSIVDTGFIWDMYPADDIHISVFGTFMYKQDGTRDNSLLLSMLPGFGEPDFHDPFEVKYASSAVYMASRYVSAGLEFSAGDISSISGVLVNIDDQSSIIQVQLLKQLEDWIELDAVFITKTGEPFVDELASTPWEYVIRFGIKMYI